MNTNILHNQHNHHKNGLDSDGFIGNEYSSDNIQPVFTVVVESVIAALHESFPDQVHSIYLYGSVPRGNAVVGTSDLDLSVIFTSPLTPADYETIQSISVTLAAAHPLVEY